MVRKIVFCCNFYPPNFVGGAELIVHNHAKVLKSLGYDVVVFAGNNQGHGERHSIRKETYDGLTVYRVTLTWEDFQPSHINFAHSRVEGHFKDLLENFLPDVVHFHNLIGLSVGLIHLAKSKGIRTVLTLHDYWGVCYKNTLLKHEYQICRNYSSCSECLPFISENHFRDLPFNMRKDFIDVQFADVDIFISPSQYLADVYVQSGLPKEKFKVIWNGINIERFANIVKNNSNGYVRFTFIGYFGAHKGINILLDALQFLGKEHHIIVNLVGDGELSAKYKQQVRLMGLDKTVKFWGRIDNIEKAYSETDVLILPSIWPENQPVTITEAMASRIPVIASDLGGNSELVEDEKTGYLFDPGNSKDLSEKLLQFVLNPDRIKTFGENGYEKIKNNTFENQVSRITKVYNMDLNDYNQMSEKAIIACLGHHMSPRCIQAIKSIVYKNKFRFLMLDWLQEDQISLVKILWVVDKNINLNEINIGLMNKIPLLVPEDNMNLKDLCKEGNCGLYYGNNLEAESCLDYLITNESKRIAIGRSGFEAYKKIQDTME